MKENYFSCCIKKLSDEVTNLAGYAIFTFTIESEHGTVL